MAPTLRERHLSRIHLVGDLHRDLDTPPPGQEGHPVAVLHARGGGVGGMHPQELAAVADQGVDVVQARVVGPEFPQADEPERKLVVDV